jgi:hypothetical protein
MILGFLVILIGVILLLQVYFGKEKVNLGRSDIGVPVAAVIIVFGIIVLAL